MIFFSLEKIILVNFNGSCVTFSSCWGRSFAYTKGEDRHDIHNVAAAQENYLEDRSEFYVAIVIFF